nr:pyrroline-5-carboxylate reductase-like [Nerophis lumbriciformis]
MSSQVPKLAVLGAGKMGETLISALLGAGRATPERIVATALHEERLTKLAKNYDIATTLSNRAAVEGAEVVLLCVKPQIASAVLEEIADVLGEGQLLVSIIAGLSTAAIEAQLDDRQVAVARAMPNTPSRIGSGMTAVCGGRHASAEQVELVRELFAAVGRSVVLEERYFNAVTGLSASGPAFIYIVIEALAEGGVKVGLPRSVAIELAAQTCGGAAAMVLETGEHPALLKDEVTTPAGCTVDGILELEEGGLRVTLIKAVAEAARRSAELVDG